MEEIEVKILESDKDKVIKRLLELGAKKVFDGPMNSVYLDSDNELKNQNKILRIRQKGEKCIITLKVRKKDPEAKINEEYETEVKDFEEIRKKFHNLGFKEFATNFRKRISCKLRINISIKLLFQR
ncbi:class IV adenylate cyclase [Candidatus Woesearchaeota archaeon]|nr:MAG: class IV adenylate cyclase [Candidatus Woesearchaeota archaeon]